MSTYTGPKTFLCEARPPFTAGKSTIYIYIYTSLFWLHNLGKHPT